MQRQAIKKPRVPPVWKLWSEGREEGEREEEKVEHFSEESVME